MSWFVFQDFDHGIWVSGFGSQDLYLKDFFVWVSVSGFATRGLGHRFWISVFGCLGLILVIRISGFGSQHLDLRVCI